MKQSRCFHGFIHELYRFPKWSISRRGQAAPPRRSLPARARREGGKQGLGPGCGGRVECLEMAKNQVAGAGTRTRRLQEEAAQWDCADYLWGGGGGSRRGIHSQVSDCGEIGSVDKRCPVPEPPAPFSRALGSSPKVAAHPRDHPLQKTNNTLAEDDSLFETAIVRRAKSPPADRSQLHYSLLLHCSLQVHVLSRNS